MKSLTAKGKYTNACIKEKISTLATIRKQDDALYQVRNFIAVYNTNLEEALNPGQFLFVDESMNQWLGKDAPFIKKIPRKPHPVGQEFKIVADAETSIILRLDLSGENKEREYDDIYGANGKTIATVSRLAKPWFGSGRTIIADSWFGSPRMIQSMKEHGFYSIMAVKKRRFWPKEVPGDDIMTSREDELGACYTLEHYDEQGRPDGMYLCALRDLKPKLLITNCARTTTSTIPIKRYFDGEKRLFHRPLVYDEYEKAKGMSIMWALS